MKYFFTFIIFLGSLLLCAQEEVPKQSELDSIAATNDIKSFNIVEDVPIYKGCENSKTYSEKKECLNQKLGEFFKENFNTILPDDSKVPSGKVRILVAFNVDEQANIVDGTAEGPDKYLENEALRVLKLLPKFASPGYFRGEPIEVPFSFPIIAIVSNKNDQITDVTYPVYRGCSEELSFEQTKQCTSDKIIDYLKVSFNYELADKAFPTDLTTKFFVEFVINKKGRTEQINVKAHHKAIAVDVIQLIKRMPKFKAPGSSDGKPVETRFSALVNIRLLG
ncbi:hypothetical protein DFQ09_10986 [Winogradskyella pacifica]|uniref:TonB-like protein n=1 Tax=Winogradskyella pacifica TaxID=664642 RepID=A0A3D9LLA0_9FLAO|nr:hypothetical protein [Winogradskyella pacifica]REE08025.1 hypothetical protein DFQ09_10986 [Winogradskyella pacifica]